MAVPMDTIITMDMNMYINKVIHTIITSMGMEVAHISMNSYNIVTNINMNTIINTRINMSMVMVTVRIHIIISKVHRDIQEMDYRLDLI